MVSKIKLESQFLLAYISNNKRRVINLATMFCFFTAAPYFWRHSIIILYVYGKVKTNVCTI